MRAIAKFWLGLRAGAVVLASSLMVPANGMGSTTGPQRLRSSIPEMQSSRQLIVVTTEGWNDTRAMVRLFTRPDAPGTPWRESGKTFPAVVGARGCAWGIGLHGTGPAGAPRKTEGDRRAPAGVFSLYSVFGLSAPAQVRFLRFPYRQVVATTEAVDDPRSRYYNRIVNREAVPRPDWTRSESMRRVGGRYRFGVMVEHNWQQAPGCGSCIFLHVWGSPTQGTVGCTAMGAADLNRLLHWLNAEDNPLVVQLPIAEYRKLAAPWGLPALGD